jgi:hypothetical protein
MRGQVVSEEIKRYKVNGVLSLIEGEEDLSVIKACKRMRIKRRTFYDYKKLMDDRKTLKDNRVVGLDDFQKCWLELCMKMYEDLTISQYVGLLNDLNLINSFVFKVESLEVTRYAVWNYQLNRRGADGKIEIMSSYEDRVKNIIKVHGDLAGSFFVDGGGWEYVRNLFAPKNYVLRKIKSGRKDR